MDSLFHYLRNSQTQYLTLTNKKTGVYYSYRITKRNDSFFVAVLSGTRSERTYFPIGYFTDYSTEFKSRKSDDHSKKDYFKGFAYVLSNPERAELNENLQIDRKRALQAY